MPDTFSDLETIMQADAHRLRKLARKPKERERFDTLLAKSKARVEQRRANLPQPSFPDELPVSHRLDDIAAALEKHQVIVVCGETGSGKSTQLPKLMLKLGRGTRGLIAHTQPRRVAARAIARRLSEEMNTELGKEVGFKIRFSDHVSHDTYVKVLTDGMLLAEAQGDRFLDQYDTIIIDEAHERSLNIDFLLGYLKQLLPKRPDLKVIITSATIDPESFSKHFPTDGEHAPIVLVSGRTYPVEVRYRALRGDDEDARDRSQLEGILDAVDECWQAGPGDILVFLSGEREIRETAEALRKHHPPGTEILPLFSRLSAAEQDRVFKPGHAKRIVLATNVAETSLTVPRIRYVIDPGKARLSRYSYRSKVQRLPIEKISQASADQRKGRCGRVSDGVCVRLYDEEDFLSRPEFTDPEIHRTNLAAVILQMQLLKLGDIESFPFLDPPDTRFVNDGYRLLQELEAVDDARRVTELGRRIARLPMDPRLARMLLAADRQNCLAELLIITSALTVQDQRERPLEMQQQADAAHAQFADPKSDFTGVLNLWNRFHEERKHRSGSQLRRWCKENFLSYLRIREWHDTHQQVKGMLAEQGMKFSNAEISPEEMFPRIHRAVLAGCLGQVGLKDEDLTFTGPRGLKFQVWPGSSLAKSPPKWVVAAEFVETQKVWGRTIAGVQAGWIEEVAAHLVNRDYSEPRWDRRSGRVTAAETVTLFGLPLASGRRVDYGSKDPKLARELFIRDGLVPGELDGNYLFLEHNLRLIEEIESLEARVRRRDILVDADTLAQFYAERLPENIYDGITFKAWYRRHKNDAEQRLRADRETLLARNPHDVTESQFPEAILVNGVPMPLEYHFAPGGELDGVILDVPVELVGQVPRERPAWLVPGYIEEKVTAMIRALPKALRRNFVPAPDFARAAVESMPFAEGNLHEQLAKQLTRMSGNVIEPEVFHGLDIPAHLLMKFRLRDANGNELASGADLSELQQRYAAQATQQVRGLDSAEWPEIEGTDWIFGEMPDVTEITASGRTLKVFPALDDREFRVTATLCATDAEARRTTRRGILKLLELTAKDTLKFARKNIPRFHETCLKYKAVSGDCEALREDIVAAALESAAGETLDTVRNEAAYRELETGIRERLQSEVNALGELAGEILDRHHAIRKQLSGKLLPAMLAAIKDIDTQLNFLVHPGFVRATPFEWLQRFPRYLEAIELRLERLPNNPGKDRAGQVALNAQLERLSELSGNDAETLDALCLKHPGLATWRWMIEEFRVSLFAQELKTAMSVSGKRLDEQWQAARKAMR
ncbi:MAG TPA: ATP-dependent RNA helicase HrpA [Gammaproteobacteria bacterium]